MLGEEAIPEITPSKENVRIITLSWNKEDDEEIASAKSMFREYIRKGWLAFAFTSGNIKKQVFTFNPEYEKIQLVPIVEGG
uniref:Uncharacterized protein n=1 Tax=uncultured marine crenarchaeote E48-1C TaxID=907718 RepID=G9BAT0_9ARCH|nr:hypothetical protein E48-1C_10 [uncultured marine crenarchaeote E48-1C]